MKPQNPSRDLLFLCSGNVLRSAFCELYARHLELPGRIQSAATEYRNSGLFPESRTALQARGVSPGLLNSFRPRHVADFGEPPEQRTIVFGMTRSHLTAFRRTFGEQYDTRLMLSVLERDEEVDDPFFTNRFDETFATLAACVEKLYSSVR